MNYPISRLDSLIRAAGIPIDGVSGSQGEIRIDYQSTVTDLQRTQAAAIVASFDWTDFAAAVFDAQQSKKSAAAVFDRGLQRTGTMNDRVVIALAQLMLDEFNNHTTVESAMFAAIAAATTLADLKVRFAAIIPATQRTQLQLINAIKTKILATAE